jgi:two-component system CheB/CheR fusion protein
MSPDCVIETWNAGARRLFGYTAQEIVGNDLRRFVSPRNERGHHNIPAHPGDEAAWRRIMDDLRAGHAIQRDMVGRTVDGGSVDVSASFTPHWGLLGELTTISVIMRDIAQRRAVERLQQEFIAITTHELRSPVTGIKGHAQLMQRRGVYSERAVEAIVSQVQSDRFAMTLEETDLVAAARLAVAHMAAGDPAIQIDAPAEPLRVPADPHRLNQVLTNLLTNAVKYSPEGGDITVRLTRAQDEARVSVVDRGVGIPREALPHLFDRFYRVSDMARQVQGLGLGLYICRRIVEAHGGRIEVESEPGQGSTFTVALPLQPAGVE